MKLLNNNGTSLLAGRATATAADVMTAQPVSVSEEATLRDAAAFLTGRRISAAPVIDEAGRPVGVISLSDIARHVCGAGGPQALDAVDVREVMTADIYFVRPETPLSVVIDDLLTCGVHRLFVVDGNDVVIGVISALDMLRHLGASRHRVPDWHRYADF